MRTDTAHAAAPPAAQASDTLDVSFVLDEGIDVLAVPATFRGSDLRKQLAKQYLPESKIKLFLLKHPDGSWPSQDDAAKAVGVEMRYVSHLRTIIGELGDEDIVHIRVEVIKTASDDVDEAQSDGDHSSLEDQVGKYNTAMSKKRKPTSQKVRFTDCDEATTEAMYNIKRAKYKQTQRALPAEYAEALRGEYHRRVVACGEPWLQSECQRRLFINSVLVTCVAAAIEVNKQQLSLMTEKIVKPDSIDGSGIADYVISRGDRMVAIVEANDRDMEKAQHQNFAAMEAARILNRSVNSDWHSIQGICTDFQNWIFIRRDSGVLETDHDATFPVARSQMTCNAARTSTPPTSCANWFIQSPNRGLFMIHGTGSGKTLSAIAIAEHMKRYRECVVIAPRSLRDNFMNEIKRYGSNVDTSRYRFVSSNASNMIEKLETSEDTLTGIDVKSLHLDNKLIIIDETHHLLVGMSNGSKLASALYDMLMSAKNCRILLMTASAIINNMYEVVPALNICKGCIWTDSDELTPLLPERAEDFYRNFFDEKAGKIKNADKLRNRMRGLISYKGPYFDQKVLPFYQMLKTTIKQEDYPDRLPIKVELIPMSTMQYEAYEQAREKERLKSRQAKGGGSWEKGSRIILYPTVPSAIDGGELKKDSAFGKSTSYRMQSRQVSNIWRPEDIDVATVNANIGTYSPKIEAIGKTLKPGTKSLIYSAFVQSGIMPMASYLERLGYQRFEADKQRVEHDSAKSNSENSENPEKSEKIKSIKYYGIYTGAVSTEDRTATLQEYNKRNSSLTVLLISSSGAEGLSAKRTRDIFIMESYWNWERSLQVMARGIRYKSHDTLPEDERNVQVCLYLAVPPKDIKSTEKTTDVHLFTQSVRKYEANSEMIKLMASVSVECSTANKNANFDCYRCEPRNGAPLFLNNLDQDMQYPLPCERDLKPLEATEITINDQLYYVTDTMAGRSAQRVFTRGKANDGKDDSDEYIEIIDNDIKKWILDRLPPQPPLSNLPQPPLSNSPLSSLPHSDSFAQGGFYYPPTRVLRRNEKFSGIGFESIRQQAVGS